MFSALIRWIRNLMSHDLIEKIARLTAEIVEKNREINLLKIDLLDCEEKTDELELLLGLKKYSIYKELFKTDNVYRGNRIFYTKETIYTYNLPKIQDYFLCSGGLLDKELSKINISETDDDLKIFSNVLHYVNANYSYKRDFLKFGVDENWESIDNLIVSKKGDCETLTMLVIMLCRRAGVDPNKVFMADGLYYVKQTDAEYGHAWPVLWYNDKWYVGESTAMQPIEVWSNVKDRYICLWGMSNDVFSTKIKNLKTYCG